MRTRFNSNLGSIKDMTREVSQLILISYDRIDLYLDNKNDENLDHVIELYDDIRRGASGVESFCFELLALQQPVAKDLRLLQMEIKLASTFKRIASHLNSAAEILKSYWLSEKEIDFLKKFIENEKNMLEDGIKAFVTNNKDLALDTIEKDQINNDLFIDAINFAADENKNDKISAVELSNKILLFKYFERLGDRLARVAELATRL
ncbi:phosphate signaling complex PhoU family protein [Anaerococcus degeneri]|uniref:Phosphate uptake regulator PhoU n=1 Tax=Anaerococcus degeneri TaxID=361500 RepID=A0ABS7YVT0_9FIRM|nr:PhoU domain-containing protein [Anaerococcus degeneri]MBP2015471.1 phosphate transport system protein [Anaerococcus degeneri]MCA2095827.1 phosphate uptake regulator PhoU [Anaerococcus degeneri]